MSGKRAGMAILKAMGFAEADIGEHPGIAAPIAPGEFISRIM